MCLVSQLNFCPVGEYLCSFFLSGYFFKNKYLDDVVAYVKKKVKHLMTPFIGYELFYAILTTVLLAAGFIKFGRTLSMASAVGVMCNKGSGWNGFTMAMWFVPALLLVQIFYIAVKKVFFAFCKNEWVLLVFFICLNLLSVKFSRLGYQHNGNIGSPGYSILLFNACFLLAYYQLGYVYHNYIEKHDSFSFTKLVSPFIINAFFIGILHINLHYDVRMMKFNHDILPLHFIVGALGIYFWLHFSDLIAKVVSENDFIHKISEKSYDIMVHHFLGIWLLNIFFIALIKLHILKVSKFSYANFLNDGIKYQLPAGQPFTNVLYVIVGILFSVCVGTILDKITLKTKSLISKK